MKVIVTGTLEKQIICLVNCRRNFRKTVKRRNLYLFYFILLVNMLQILSTLVFYLFSHRTNLGLATLTQFFSTLSSVLEYRATVVEAFKEMSRCTVNNSLLSNKDILLLLHKWSIIDKDLQLQDDLQALAQKYQITDLLSK